MATFFLDMAKCMLAVTAFTASLKLFEFVRDYRLCAPKGKEEEKKAA